MGTVVAIESRDGVVIASDTRSDDTLGGNARRLVDLGALAVGVVGRPTEVDAFDRRFGAAVRERRVEHEGALTLETVARTAARTAKSTGVDAALAARDDGGTPRVRELGADGRLIGGPTVALGTGSLVALGDLEAARLDIDLGETEQLARAALRTASERDAETNAGVELWSLGPDAGAGVVGAGGNADSAP
jgi:20S proteasome alpha/beta subunit